MPKSNAEDGPTVDVPLMCSTQVVEFNNASDRDRAVRNLQAMMLPPGFTVAVAEL